MNKKAQIGQTLTWFSAVLIIFFIMVVFIVFTILISINKDVGQVEIQGINGVSLGAQRELINLLDTKVNDVSLYDFILSKNEFSDEDVSKITSLSGNILGRPESWQIIIYNLETHYSMQFGLKSCNKLNLYERDDYSEQIVGNKRVSLCIPVEVAEGTNE